MEKRLTADLNVVSNSNLEIQLLDGDLNIIQKLDDEPNDVGGLTSAELKAKFDESGNIIKKYINETLIPAVLTDDATEESRKQAEAARVAAEQGRVTAEEGRVSAESGRVSAEQARANAEASRVSAETAREAAETARADETAGIVARATAQANAAAGSASQAAGSEQAAQSAANTATSAASSASQSAATASGSASQAQASAAAAAQSAASVDGVNKTAQSWAVGGTGTRPGEDTNNAKYWAQQAQAAVGGDFATKTEAQGYVDTHNQSVDAHADIRAAVAGSVRYDTAQSLSDAQKEQARDNIGAAKPTYLGRILRNKIYKIGSFIAGSGESSSGAVTLKICNINEYGFENYMMVFLSYDGACNVEYHGNIGSTNESKVFVYSDPKTTGSAKQFLIFVRTANYADWTTVCIDNEHSFRRDFVDVTDTFSTLVDGLDKLWESQLEYANPPMLLGVEYRTTERYLGKPVYVKTVDCGLPQTNTTWATAHGISTAKSFISVTAQSGYYIANGIFKSSEGLDGDSMTVATDPINIHISTYGTWSTSEHVIALIKYTKTTD